MAAKFRWPPCVFLLIVLFISVSCKNKKEDENTVAEKPVEIEYDITASAEHIADSILTSLTLEERLGQCLMPSLQANTEPATLRLYKKYIDDYHVGGVVLLQGSLKGARDLAEKGAKAKVALFIAIDAEWGLGMRLEDAPVFPRNGKLSKDTEEGEMYDYGREIAEECREVGINMVLGPVVDIVANKSGIIGTRSYGSDPGMVSDLGVAYAKGLESGGVVSVAKHFPGHGSAWIDSHKGVARIERNITMLDSVDLKPFREYINSGLTGVMAGHIQAKALDPGGSAASVSVDMLTSLLREEMGFKGLVLTDAFDMGGAKGFSAWEALKAGADIILCPLNMEKEYRNLIEAVNTGKLEVSVVNNRCRRILFFKTLFDILPYAGNEINHNLEESL